jgi:hypothetical protein
MNRFNDTAASREALVTALVDTIDADVSALIDLYFNDGEVSGRGSMQLFAVLVHAMNAWPVIEKLDAGLPIKAADRACLTALYREIRPFMDERPILVQLEAEDRADAYSRTANADQAVDRAA